MGSLYEARKIIYRFSINVLPRRGKLSAGFDKMLQTFCPDGATSLLNLTATNGLPRWGNFAIESDYKCFAPMGQLPYRI